jgi:hypothetical protein
MIKGGDTISNMTFIQDYRQFSVGWRLWMILLQIVNLIGPLFFIGRLEAWIVLAGYFLAAVVIVRMHRRLGWVRLLGIGHFIWFPMLPWLGARLAAEMFSGPFAFWLLAVIVVNGISLMIDVIDVLRYIAGDRQPIVNSAD